MLASIQHKISSCQSIDRKEALYLYQHASDEVLKALATQVKTRFHPEHEATYLVMAIVNYTNVCVARCDYCAFYREPHHKEAYLLSHEQVFAKIDELVAYGGTLVGFNGGFHPGLKLADYGALFAAVHQRYPDLAFYEMTVAEFMYASRISRLSYEQGAALLKSQGTRWITGGGAEVLDDGFRKRHSPGKFTVSQYYSAQRSILDAGLGSTATMVIGFDESIDERLNHLEMLRQFQDTTDRALPSFLCWTYKPYHSQLGGQEITSGEYMRWLAICRIYLDNIRHIRTSVLTRNEEALSGLRYGADDFDIPTEDEVTQKAGATISHDFEAILQKAKDMGIATKMRQPFPLRLR